jgi:hypothetical protein
MGACVLVALTACWNVKKQDNTGGGGSGGEGGAGGDSCSACGDVVLRGEPASGLCATSKKPFENVQACACDPQKCAIECSDNLCLGGTASLACSQCAQPKCATDFAICSNDTSH